MQWCLIDHQDPQNLLIVEVTYTYWQKGQPYNLHIIVNINNILSLTLINCLNAHPTKNDDFIKGTNLSDNL